MELDAVQNITFSLFYDFQKKTDFLVINYDNSEILKARDKIFSTNDHTSPFNFNIYHSVSIDTHLVINEKYFNKER